MFDLCAFGVDRYGPSYPGRLSQYHWSRKSAILLMSLGEDQAGKLFALLDDEEIKEISQVMAGLGTVSSNIVERLFVEFAEQLSSTGSLVGSMDSTQRFSPKFWEKIVLMT